MTYFPVSDGLACAIQFVIPFRLADASTTLLPEGIAWIYPSGTWIVILPNGRRFAQTTEQIEVLRSRFFQKGR